MVLTLAFFGRVFPHEHRFWLKLLARLNINETSVSLDIFQADKSWLKDVANANICSMLVTPETFQRDKSWLKAAAAENMEYMLPGLVTCEVSQVEMLPLNEDAKKNIIAISWQLDVFHDDKS